MVNERMAAYPMVWWGFVTAPFIYAGVLLFALPAPAPGQDLMLPVVLVALGVVQTLAAQVLWVQVKRGAFAGRARPNGNPLPMPVITWALDESAAVFGLVIAFLGAPQAWSFALFGVAVVALMLNPYWTLDAQT